jgi:hypothetical protein
VAQGTEREGVLIDSFVAADDFAPLVRFRWSVAEGAMGPEEARNIGRLFFEAAAEAEADSATCRALEGGGYSKEDAARFLVFVRENRERNGLEDGG